jgi:hypothetical protein
MLLKPVSHPMTGLVDKPRLLGRPHMPLSACWMLPGSSAGPRSFRQTNDADRQAVPCRLHRRG